MKQINSYKKTINSRIFSFIFFATSTFFFVRVDLRRLRTDYSLLLSFQRRGAADDLGQLAGDLRLAGAGVEPGEGLDHPVGVLGGPPHGDHPGDLFADGRVEEALEQADLERHRDDLLEDALRVREELVRDPLALPRPGLRPGGGLRLADRR